MVLSSAHVLNPLLSVGEADIQAFDIVFLIVACKVVVSILKKRRDLHIERVYWVILIFLSCLLATTVSAYVRFGREVFVGEIIALLRMTVQMSVLFLTIQVVKEETLVGRIVQGLDYVGYLVALTIYTNIFLIQIGRQLGEVQIREGLIRFFGPLGDQVGFLLPYFAYKHLLAGKFFKAGLFVVAVVLTGTRGALISLLVGLLVLAWHRSRHFRKGASWAILGLLGVLWMIVVALWFDFGGMRTRFLDEEILKSGITQRWLTASIALQVFAHNILTGVGFTGFRYVALDYGAVEVATKELGGFAPNFVATAGNQYLQVATDGGIITLAVFIWMLVIFGRTLRRAELHTFGEQRISFAAGYLWLLSLAIGNQSAAWMLPGSLISYFLWILLGLAIAVVRLKVYK